MAIKCMDCGLIFANSTRVASKGCRCGSRNLVDKSNPFAPDKPQQQNKIITPVEKPVIGEQPPVKPVEE